MRGRSHRSYRERWASTSRIGRIVCGRAGGEAQGLRPSSRTTGSRFGSAGGQVHCDETEFPSLGRDNLHTVAIWTAFRRAVHLLNPELLPGGSGGYIRCLSGSAVSSESCRKCMQLGVQREKMPAPTSSQFKSARVGSSSQLLAAGSNSRCHSDKEKPRVLVTGAGGFVGRHLIPFLVTQGYKVIAASRNSVLPLLLIRTLFPLPSRISRNYLNGSLFWNNVMQWFILRALLTSTLATTFTTASIIAVLRRWPWRYLEAALKHLVFISTIAAQSGSYADRELTESDFPTPSNAYGRSKFAAEQAIRAAGISFTILRPVVIYGDGEKGNFAAIHRLSRLPIPLPFGALTARRSVLSIQNFDSAVETALSNPNAREKLSSYRIQRRSPLRISIARHRTSLGRSPWLVPVPESWIKASLKVVGQTAVWDRIGRSLVAPPTKLLSIGWKPS